MKNKTNPQLSKFIQLNKILFRQHKKLRKKNNQSQISSLHQSQFPTQNSKIISKLKASQLLLFKIIKVRCFLLFHSKELIELVIKELMSSEQNSEICNQEIHPSLPVISALLNEICSKQSKPTLCENFNQLRLLKTTEK